MINLTTFPPGSSPAANVVTRKVFINGDELGREVLLLHLSVHKVFNKIASAKLIFRDGDVAGRDFGLSNDDRFRPGAEIKLQLGYDSSPETIFEGIIVRHNIRIKPDGLSHLFIEAKNKAVTLTGTRKNKNFINKKDSEVIEEIVRATGMQCEAQETLQTNKQLVQYDATDWDFLVTRAEVNSMLVLTDDDKIIFKKPDTEQPPVATATYGANLLEFEGEMDARRQYKSVMAKTWDFSSQQLEVSEPGSASYNENGNISSDNLGNVLGTEKELRHSGKIDPGELQDWADAYALRSKIAKAAGKLKLQGNAAIKPGTTITLDGVGDRFNGNVLVTGVKHTYNGDWHTDVQFGWTEDLFYKKDDVMDKPAGGMLPGIHGLQIGVVTQLESDPESEARIRVRLPIVDTDNEGIWCRVASPDAGDERGFFFRPEIGDEVVLGFLNDDPREPVVLGMLNSSAKPAPLEAQDANNIKAYVSRSKLKLTFDDEKKSIKLETPGGRILFLDDESGVIQMKDSTGNKIVMDNTGITIQAQGNLVLKGNMIMIN